MGLRGIVAVFALDFANYLRERLEEEGALRFPLLQFQGDPVGFAYFVLGVLSWSKQVELLEAFRDCDRGAVYAGRKVSKSFSVAILALWAYCCFPRAQVILISTTGEQIENILWSEIRRLVVESGRCLKCRKEDPDGPTPCPHSIVITGKLGAKAGTGLVSEDFRSIRGKTAKSAEAAAGASGNVFYLVDEASGVPAFIVQTIIGNLAGGGKLWQFGNPTKTEGEFFRACTKPKHYERSIQISSLDSPNVVEGRKVIPGMAERTWVEQQKEIWGEDSALFKVHVLGQFVEGQDGKVFPVGVLDDAVKRYGDTEAEGPLHIGIDCAGEGGHGDESVFVARRGWKILEIAPRRGLTAEGHLVECLAIIGRHRNEPREMPIVCVDVEGDIGTKVRNEFRAYVEEHPNRFQFVPFRASWKALREQEVVNRNRDLLWYLGAKWLLDGGAIPDDPILIAELNFPSWDQLNSSPPKLFVTPKDEFRKSPDKGGLGRSSDRADGVLLSIWEPQGLDEQLDEHGIGRSDMGGSRDDSDFPVTQDIYDAADGFR